MISSSGAVNAGVNGVRRRYGGFIYLVCSTFYAPCRLKTFVSNASNRNSKKKKTIIKFCFMMLYSKRHYLPDIDFPSSAGHMYDTQCDRRFGTDLIQIRLKVPFCNINNVTALKNEFFALSITRIM